MRRLSMLIALGTAGLLLGATAVPAEAATGRVVVFSTELSPLAVYEDPAGCYAFPPLAHVLANETDRPVRIHPDPFCAGPGLTVRPGFGTHVPEGTGSFSL